jgi:hypothetical protein
MVSIIVVNKGDIMNKRDLREYSDNELSLLVFNDEYLYKQRKTILNNGVLDELFIYSPEQ